jgi:hypothetical protein
MQFDGGCGWYSPIISLKYYLRFASNFLIARALFLNIPKTGLRALAFVSNRVIEDLR